MISLRVSGLIRLRKAGRHSGCAVRLFDCAATDVYLLPSGKGWVRHGMGQLSLSGISAPFCIGCAPARRALIMRFHRRALRAGAKKRNRERMLATRLPRGRVNTLASRWRKSRCTERLTAARTVCLLARRRLREESADVLPVRQRNCSKIDYCYCPRH